MKKSSLIIAFVFCLLWSASSQNKSSGAGVVNINPVKKQYNIGDTIVLTLNTNDTFQYYTLEVMVYIKGVWYYDDLLTCKFNNSGEDKLIPIRKTNNGIGDNRFIVDKAFNSKANQLRFRITVYKTKTLLDEAVFLYSPTFASCEASEITLN